MRASPSRGAMAAVRSERGTTLIELMVVVAILAVIAAIALIVLYQDVVQKSRLAADHGIVAALRSAVSVYYGKHEGVFPPDKATVDGLVTPAPAFQCPGQAYTYDPANGMVRLVVNDRAGC